MSVPGEHIRRILLTALDMGYIDTGEYVFMDVELFEFKGHYWGDHSWIRHDARDDDAKKAFTSLLRIALHEPTGPRFDNFSQEVKARASRDYNFTFGNEKVSCWLYTFHNKVICLTNFLFYI